MVIVAFARIGFAALALWPASALAQTCQFVPGRPANWCHTQHKHEMPGIPGGGFADQPLGGGMPGIPQQAQSGFQQEGAGAAFVPQANFAPPAPQQGVPWLPPNDGFQQPAPPPPPMLPQAMPGLPSGVGFQQPFMATCIVDDAGNGCQFPITSPVGSGTPCQCDGVQGNTQ